MNPFSNPIHPIQSNPSYLNGVWWVLEEIDTIGFWHIVLAFERPQKPKQALFLLINLLINLHAKVVSSTQILYAIWQQKMGHGVWLIWERWWWRWWSCQGYSYSLLLVTAVVKQKKTMKSQDDILPFWFWPHLDYLQLASFWGCLLWRLACGVCVCG